VAKRVFGDFRLSLGLVLLTNNIVFTCRRLALFVGISVYVAAPAHAAWPIIHGSRSALRWCYWRASRAECAGPRVGKWVNNLGGIGTAVTGDHAHRWVFSSRCVSG